MYCSTPKSPQGSRAYPDSYSMDAGISFTGVKVTRREDDHSSLSSAEVKNKYGRTSTSLMLSSLMCIGTTVSPLIPPQSSVIRAYQHFGAMYYFCLFIIIIPLLAWVFR
jgi:hypothetical protein